MKKIISLTLGALLLFVLAGCEDPKSAKKQASTSGGEVKTLKCQTVLNAKGDEVIMLKDFTDTVTKLTGGSLKFRKLRSQDPSHDSFLLGTWARVSR